MPIFLVPPNGGRFSPPSRSRPPGGGCRGSGREPHARFVCTLCVCRPGGGARRHRHRFCVACRRRHRHRFCVACRNVRSGDEGSIGCEDKSW